MPYDKTRITWSMANWRTLLRNQRRRPPAANEIIDSRAAKCECVNVVRQGYSISGGNDQGTWGVLPEQTYDLSSTLSMWRGNHTMKTGASFTYDVTKQIFAPLQNGRYTFSGSPAVVPNPFQFSQAFALTPEAWEGFAARLDGASPL